MEYDEFVTALEELEYEDYKLVVQLIERLRELEEKQNS